MDYRKAWEAVKLKVERSLEEGEDRHFNEDSDTRESGMYEAYKRIHDHMIELESATPEPLETPKVSELTLGKMRGKLVESCSSRPDCDGCPLHNTDNCNFSHVDGDHMTDDDIREAFAIMFPEGSSEAASMEAGTLLLVNRTAPGAIGAEHKVAVVTDEPNKWGLSEDRPGYNVAVLTTGQIWRISPESEVDILYRPHK